MGALVVTLCSKCWFMVQETQAKDKNEKKNLLCVFTESYTSAQLRSTISFTRLLYSRLCHSCVCVGTTVYTPTSPLHLYTHLFSEYKRAASELAGELGLGSHSRDCRGVVHVLCMHCVCIALRCVYCTYINMHTWMDVKIADTS